ncbi:MAG TPA: porin family protein [Hanamia sp.]|jgi:hypothetical protein|nr:porin family protein [Hanamia sp.]
MKNSFSKSVSLLFLLLAFVFLSQNTSAQTFSSSKTVSKKMGLGFRVGLNYAKVSGGTDSIQYRYKPGLMVSVFLAPPSTGILGYRSELLYSKQGFDYTNPQGKTGTVSNDYLMLPQMMTLNITKYVQLQAGAFAGYLLHTKDSNEPKETTTNTDPSQTALGLMNRFDYGAAGGIEIHPFKGLILNARYNMGFAKLYKEQSDVAQTTPTPSFNPLARYENIDTKNAVIQLSVGYRF